MNRGTIERQKAQPLLWSDINNIRIAIRDLKDTRDRLYFADAPRAAKYVARALKSVEGALRHANRRAQS